MQHLTLNSISIPVLLLWVVALVGAVPALRRTVKFPFGMIALFLGWALLAAWKYWLWQSTGEPPMRSLAQTMFLVALCVPLIDLGFQLKWRTTTQSLPATILAIVFFIGGQMMSETTPHPMPPALRSPLFAPHVMVYMLSYATFAIATVLAGWAVFAQKADKAQMVEEVRRLIYFGFPLMTTGMLLGALWGKIAWGQYWGWDPKETGAFLSWSIYLIYLHLDARGKLSPRSNLGLAAGSFLLVLGCWFAVNYLPSASMSVHTYSMGK